MTFRTTLFLLCALSIGFATSPSYAGDIISCDSFENCPDGSEPLTNQLIQLENKIDALEALLAGVSRVTDPNTSQDTLRFTNMNVQIVSGNGTTAGAKNGKGNLIIGYNEKRDSGDDRTGSHMLVIGRKNNYTSYGGMVVGIDNTASDQYASVSGGTGNTASGSYASVSGGTGNTADAKYASVSGGVGKTATSNWCTVAGDVGTDCIPPKQVFITSGTYNGDLGGLVGADAICTADANAAGLTGAYKAWLSDSSASPSTRFTRSGGPYSLVDGVRIAANWDDLVDGDLDAPINVQADGSSAVGFSVWTGTSEAGIADGFVQNLRNFCGSWFDGAFGSDAAMSGDAELRGAGWSTTGVAQGCVVSQHLYCFQQ